MLRRHLVILLVFFTLKSANCQRADSLIILLSDKNCAPCVQKLSEYCNTNKTLKTTILLSFPESVLGGRQMLSTYSPFFPNSIFVLEPYKVDKRKKPVYSDSSLFKVYNVKYTPAIIFRKDSKTKYLDFFTLFNDEKKSLKSILDKVNLSDSISTQKYP